MLMLQENEDGSWPTNSSYEELFHGNWIKYTLEVFSFEEFSYTMKYNRTHEILSKRGAEFLRCHYFQGKSLLTTYMLKKKAATQSLKILDPYNYICS